MCYLIIFDLSLQIIINQNLQAKTTPQLFYLKKFQLIQNQQKLTRQINFDHFADLAVDWLLNL